MSSTLSTREAGFLTLGTFVGYLDASHVGPAVGGAVVFSLGMILSRTSRQDR